MSAVELSAAVGVSWAQDAVLCREWMRAAATWTDHEAAAALTAVIVHRFTDGRGVLARPIAGADLALWLGCSRWTAHARLGELVELGALRIARRWMDGPGDEAIRYDLAPHVIAGHYIGGPRLDPAVVLAPVWSVLGHSARALWSALGPSPARTVDLAESVGLGVGDRTCGALLLLRRLAEVGLVERIGRGRGTRWAVGAVDLGAAAVAVGAPERFAALEEVITAERAVWHAASRADREQAAREFRWLRAARRTADQRTPSPPMLPPA